LEVFKEASAEELTEASETHLLKTVAEWW